MRRTHPEFFAWQAPTPELSDLHILACPRVRTLYGRRYRNHHAGGGEKCLAEVRDGRREHVVQPQAKCKKGGSNERERHRGIAEDRPAREGFGD